MEEKILNVLISMQSDICNMKSDICNMKSDICDMKSDIKEMKQDIKQLKERVDVLEEKVDMIDQKHDKNYIELRNQRQIDSNNIAKILNVQTQMRVMLENRMYA